MKELLRDSRACEKPLWQIEWQSIPFKGLGIKLSTSELAKSNFYQAFYSKLFEKYENYNSLPKAWRDQKTAVACVIGSYLDAGGTVLSYGCGLGYVEKIIIEKNSSITLFAYDQVDTAALWLKQELGKIKYINEIEPDAKFDMVYACQVTYALSFLECGAFFKDMGNLLRSGGALIIIHTSLFSEENGLQIKKRSLLAALKSTAKNLIRSHIGADGGDKQFWGWERSDGLYVSMAKNAGFTISEKRVVSNQSFLVFKKD